jgi:predicted outer membrane repeat protein
MERLILVCLCVFFAVVPVAAETYLVNPDGSGDFPSIRQAVNAALDGDVIQLGDGVFTGLMNKDSIIEHIALTIQSVSGNPSACVIDCDGSSTYPHNGFTVSGLNFDDTIIEDIKFIGGYAARGGAIAVEDHAGAIVRNCIFESNGADKGGAISVGLESSVEIESCVFIANHADGSGGAVYCYGDVPGPVNQLCGAAAGKSASRSELLIESCRFIGNTSTFTVEGGAVSCREVEMTLSNCDFIENGSNALGMWASTTTINNCTFTGHTYLAIHT